MSSSYLYYIFSSVSWVMEQKWGLKNPPPYMGNGSLRMRERSLEPYSSVGWRNNLFSELFPLLNSTVCCKSLSSYILLTVLFSVMRDVSDLEMPGQFLAVPFQLYCPDSPGLARPLWLYVGYLKPIKWRGLTLTSCLCVYQQRSTACWAETSVDERPCFIRDGFTWLCYCIWEDL